ncbi:MAG: hypothetical protein JW704_01505 [Anaerolineaceae bacterium]|nr:hypothetical protein [Anaerolineaceae bacterium]MBN2678026.1 hypothetical protein [Anaerolineaceae bacterium]
MSTPADRYKTGIIRTGSVSSWVKTIISLARSLIGYFDLTEEEQAKAGIFLDYDR